MQSPHKQSVLLIALCARPYVEALKVAGFNVVVIDGFLDQETRFFADDVYQVAFDSEGFSEAHLLATIDQLLLNHDFNGCLYGAGFEGNHNLLKAVQERVALIGNSPHVVEAITQPSHFFTKLSELVILHPLWWSVNQRHLAQEQSSNVWLSKQIGGSGGGHIQPIKDLASYTWQPNRYLQEAIIGEPISVLLLAVPHLLSSETSAIVLGFHTQWSSGSQELPYQMAGLVQLDRVDNTLANKLTDLIDSVVNTFGLVGLNSMDVVVKDGEIYVLEVNPRLSLSLDLYSQDYLKEAQVNLMQLHTRVGLFERNGSKVLEQSIIHAIDKIMAYHGELRSGHEFRAIGVVYAEKRSQWSEAVVWPDWVVDRPANPGSVEKNQPICSVLASAASSAEAKNLVLARIKHINSTMLK